MPLRRTGLRNVLLLPVLLLVGLGVLVTACLGYVYGQRATDELIEKLVAEATAGLHTHLRRFLEPAQVLAASNADALQAGAVDARALFERPEAWFVPQHRRFTTVDDIYFGRSDGAIVGVDRVGDQLTLKITTAFPVRSFFPLDAEGRRGPVARTGSYDATQRDWYRAALQAGAPVWSPVYLLQNKAELGLTAAAPARGPDGRLAGVMGVNVTLRSISEYMEAHPIGGRSMVYIAEPDGALVATSSLVQLAVQTAAGTRRVKAAESDDPIVRGSHAALAGAAPEATDGRPMPPLQVTLDGSEFRVYRTRFSAGPGLDWRIVVAVDPQYFLGGVRTVARNTLLVGAALLALLAALVFGVTRRLVTPIQALDRAAHQIAQGRAGVTVADDGGPAGGQELGSLVAAFNDMSLQLAEARAALDAHAQQLEATVAQRTAALAEANRDLERAHADALAASAAKSAFVAHLSHEIRTPLASITGIGYLLRSAGLAPEQQQRLDVLDAAAQHLLGVVNAVLDIAKIEAGRLELDERPLWVDAIVANVLSMLAVQAAARQIELRAELAPMPPGLLGDPVRLQQMLLNYAANALKFTARGSITVATRLEADAPHEARLRVEVRDTGPGIDAETLARLFQPFQQVAATGGVRPEGWGLGLAITRQLAGLMGGSAGAESTPGQGSVFHFTVRLRKGELPAPAAQAPADRDAQVALRERFAGRRVLLVEDSAVNVMITQAILADAGLAVDVAADGESAVARAAAQDYDAILMDVEMPVLDGLGATRRIRELARHRRTPIVASTANVFADDVRRCMAAGMDDVLPKPVDMGRLLAVLLQWLSARRA